jgi:hypothetical protein
MELVEAVDAHKSIKRGRIWRVVVGRQSPTRPSVPR